MSTTFWPEVSILSEILNVPACKYLQIGNVDIASSLRTLTIFFGLCVVVVAALVVLLGFGILCRLGFGALVVGRFVVVVVVVEVVDIRRVGWGRGGGLLLLFLRCCTVLLSKLNSLKISLYGITATYSSGFFIGAWIARDERHYKKHNFHEK